MDAFTLFPTHWELEGVNVGTWVRRFPPQAPFGPRPIHRGDSFSFSCFTIGWRYIKDRLCSSQSMKISMISSHGSFHRVGVYPTKIDARNYEGMVGWFSMSGDPPPPKAYSGCCGQHWVQPHSWHQLLTCCFQFLNPLTQILAIHATLPFLGAKLIYNSVMTLG